MPRCARAVWIYFKKNDLFSPNKFPYFVGVRTDVCNERQSTDIDDGKRKCQIVDVDKNPFSSFGHTILQQIHFHVLFLWIFFQFVWYSNDTNERKTWRVSRGTRFKVLNPNCRSSFDRFAWRNCMAASTSNKEICTFVAKEAKKCFILCFFVSLLRWNSRRSNSSWAHSLSSDDKRLSVGRQTEENQSQKQILLPKIDCCRLQWHFYELKRSHRRVKNQSAFLSSYTRCNAKRQIKMAELLINRKIWLQSHD